MPAIKYLYKELKRAQSLTLFFSVACGLAMVSEGRVYHSDASVPVKLAVQVDGCKKGASDADTFSIELEVLLRFTNVSKRPIILYRAASLDRVLIAQNRENLGEGKTEVDYKPDRITSGEQLFDIFAPDFGAKPKAPDFSVLKPDESVEVHSSVPVIVRRTRGHEIRGTLVPGEYVMVLNLSTWPYAPETAAKLQNRWKEYGHMFTGRVQSEPVFISVPDSDSEACR